MPGMMQPRREIVWAPDGVGALIKIWPLFGEGSSIRILPTLRQEDYERWQAGEYIQKALDYLSMADREWLMSGLTQTDWDETFKDDES